MRSVESLKNTSFALICYFGAVRVGNEFNLARIFVLEVFKKVVKMSLSNKT